MCSRLHVPEGQTHESALRQFDARLSVAGWGMPGLEATEVTREEDAPWWWSGEEEASDSFLASMGVVLDG
jgi:hypothetical protein